MRNYFVHGNIGKVKIEKTHLPEYPLTLSYEDILEEIGIILIFLQYIRYIFPKVDLMPNVMIKKNNCLINICLDDFFEEILFPYVTKTFTKRDLKLSKKIEDYTFKKIHAKSIVPKRFTKVLCYVKAQQNNYFNIAPPAFSSGYYQELCETIKDEGCKEGCFRLPKHVIE